MKDKFEYFNKEKQNRMRKKKINKNYYYNEYISKSKKSLIVYKVENKND